MTRSFNKTGEKDKRRSLRRNMPHAERLLWSKLRGKGIHGAKFKRQYSVESFVIDFYCPQMKLAIEIDGESHFIEGADEYDKQRQKIIESYGIRFLRFTNHDIYDNIEGVLTKIEEHLLEQPPQISHLP